MFRIVFIAGCKIINVKWSNAMTKLTKKYLSLQSGVFLMLISFTITAAGSDSRLILRSGFTFPEATSVTVTCQVTLSSGESPEGALLTLTGVNNPALYHEQYAPESGVVIFAGVIEANYRLRAVLQGYYDVEMLITILANQQIPVLMQELQFVPRNLSVDSITLHATWQEPLPETTQSVSLSYKSEGSNTGKPILRTTKRIKNVSLLSLSGYGVFLDGELVGNTPETSFTYAPLIFGQNYLAGVAALYSSGYSEQDTVSFISRYLPPPANTGGEINPSTNVVNLWWDAPEDPFTPGLPAAGLYGFSIYRNNLLIASLGAEDSSYVDSGIDPGIYNYTIAAVYDLDNYGFPGEFQESMPGESVDISFICCKELPFFEDFESGLFETNNWTVEGNNNWRIAGQAGNPAPSAEFYFNPVNENYSLSLTSDYLIGTGFIDGRIYLSCSLRHTTVVPTGKEKLAIEVFDGETWNLINTFSNIGDMNWYDQTSEISYFAKGKIFRIRFRAYGELTTDIFNWLIDNIRVYIECLPPIDFKASPEFFQGVHLSWEKPSGNSGTTSWIYWDDGTNHDAVGMQGGGTFLVATRFTPGQLWQYTGASLTRIRMFPYGPNGTLTIKVWAGHNANSLALLHTQAVSSYVSGQWNEFTLTTPIFITGNYELWIGYEVTHTETDYVAGCDNGPAIAGYGDMISLDGIVWESMSTAYGLNYNWNLQGFIESFGSAAAYIGATNEAGDSIPGYRNSGNLSKRELLGYEIYREEVYVATTQELSYFDPCSEMGIHLSLSYGVKAIYEDCESVPVYSWCRNYCPGVGVSYEKTNDLKIYPNPSTGLFYVDIEGLEGKLSVYSFTGKLLLESGLNRSETQTITLSNYPPGAYLLKFVADSGETFTGKVIVTR
jgi:hypothetical protein